MINIESEMAALLVSLLGLAGTGFSVAWVKVVQPLMHLLSNQDNFKISVEQIKKELTTNGGNSLKDTVISLKCTLDRIENRQKVIQQRTKAALHYTNIALFETDIEGRVVWHNDRLCKMFQGEGNLEGFDWLNLIQEDDREELFHDFQSCLRTNRKFVRTTQASNGKTIKLIGYPYKINDNEHGGFLVSLSDKNET